MINNRIPKNHRPDNRQNPQTHGHALPRLNGSGDRRTAQDKGSQETDLCTVGLVRAQTEVREEVEEGDGEAGDQGGEGARAQVAGYAADGGEEGEEEGCFGGCGLCMMFLRVSLGVGLWDVVGEEGGMYHCGCGCCVDRRM